MFCYINRSLLGLGALLAVSLTVPLSVAAQEYVGASSLHGKTVVMPRGTTMEGRLDRSIGSKSKQGLRFNIAMSAPVLANGTDVLIPTGSLIIGEVVEAIPAGDVPHPKGMKPTGKLRVQLSALRTPDGITYPMIASLAGETTGDARNQRAVQNLGGGVAYVGTQSSFEAVAPGMQNRMRGNSGRGPQVLTKRELMNDPIYGVDQQDQQNNQRTKIRSLYQKGRDIYIDGGSPVTVKLDAPLKIGISQAAGAEAAITPQVELNPDGTFGRRFQKTASPSTPPPPPMSVDPTGTATVAPPTGAPPSDVNPLPGILPDIPHQYVPPAQAAPAGNGIPSSPYGAAPPAYGGGAPTQPGGSPYGAVPPANSAPPANAAPSSNAAQPANGAPPANAPQGGAPPAFGGSGNAPSGSPSAFGGSGSAPSGSPPAFGGSGGAPSGAPMQAAPAGSL